MDFSDENILAMEKFDNVSDKLLNLADAFQAVGNDHVAKILRDCRQEMMQAQKHMDKARCLERRYIFEQMK